MNDVFIFFMVFLLILSAILKEHYIFTILYLFAGSYLIGGWWSRKALQNVSLQRRYTDRAFFGEEVSIRLVIANRGWLPLLWVRLHESLPVDLAVDRSFSQVLSLGPHEERVFNLTLSARKRGYYRLGPLRATSGDLLGLQREQHTEGKPDPLIVYPRIIPFTHLSLPSSSPMGTLRHHQPIFEDPTRVYGKRDYTAGDSQRRIDWKSSAASGRLQVKQFEPSIALETSIFLNLDSRDYDLKTRYDSAELAVVIAASIASWVSTHKQSVGLVTNGLDPFAIRDEDAGKSVYRNAQVVPPRKGRGHLMRVLDVLARIQPGELNSYVDQIRAEIPHLTWGTTLVMITPTADMKLFDALFQAQRSGLNAVIVLVGPSAQAHQVRELARSFKIPFFPIAYESDLSIWRK